MWLQSIVEWLQTLFSKEWLEVLFYLVGIAAAVVSVYQYWRNSRQERARWLFELYKRFYDGAALSDMRVRIDWGKTEFIPEEKEEDQGLFRQLDDFLNFFEFIAYLEERKELGRSEIEKMFDYPLQIVAKDENIAQYIRRPEYGYEGLRELLNKLGYPRKHESAQ
ncbi:MAG: hypothetical protein ACE5IP_11380 [Terriglobia bacterium]